MTKQDSIHFILTGGTIDSVYDGVKDTVVPNEHSIVPSFINSLKLYEKTRFTEVCMKDSRDTNEKDWENILQAIEKSDYLKIIITHGTYTMADTARYLKANLKRNDQTIIFTGSLIPINGFAPSDGTFNLGYAIARTQELKPGIYVCMNGKTFSPDEVVKIIHEGKFVSIFSKSN
ncbi:MAG: asparaginase domain-containing protein [bacterium]|nr:asparaginase domain-containing protein [bacterium]